MARLIVADVDGYLETLIDELTAAGWIVIVSHNDYQAPRRLRRRIASGRARLRYVVVV